MSKLQTLKCKSCGAPLHGEKCEYCGTISVFANDEKEMLELERTRFQEDIDNMRQSLFVASIINSYMI